MNKESAVKAIRAIARLNNVIENVESVFGKPRDDSQLYWLSSDLVENFLYAIGGEECDKNYDILFGISMEDDFEEVYERLMVLD